MCAGRAGPTGATAVAMVIAAGMLTAMPAVAGSGDKLDKQIERGAQGSRVVDELLACKTVAGADARLACFERTAALLDAARADRQIVVLDRAGARKVKRTVFGFSLPRINLFGGSDDDEPEVTEIDSTLTRVDSLGYDNFRYTLADNSVWQTTEALGGIPPKNGQPVKIKAGPLGSYTAIAAKGRGVRVKRLR